MNPLFTKIARLYSLAQKQKARVEELEKRLEKQQEKLNFQAQKLENQENIIDGLQNQLKVATLAGRLEQIDPIGKATLKKQISEFIKEIDRCVNFLEAV